MAAHETRLTPSLNPALATVCVCGAGTMGSGIAQVAAAAGYDTVLYEPNAAVLVGAKTRLAKTMESLVAKGRLTAPDAASLQSRIHYTSAQADCRAGLCIEAIVEKIEVKRSLFSELMELNGGEAIYATNTSSLSVRALADGLPYPAQVAGLHFFNPAPLMGLVEVVRGAETAPAVMAALLAFTKAVGKTGVVCTDSPGFIVNRVARPFYIEALRLAEQGIPYATIDALLQARGFRMGPFALMDLIGNDVNHAVSSSVWEQLGKPERLRPSHLQADLVAAGKLGKKSGSGYYDYLATP